MARVEREKERLEGRDQVSEVWSLIRSISSWQRTFEG